MLSKNSKMKILTSLAVLLFIVVVVKVEAKQSSQLIQEKLFKLRESLQKEKQTAQSAISASLINQKKFDQASPANLEMLPNVVKYLNERYPKLDKRKLFKKD